MPCNAGCHRAAGIFWNMRVTAGQPEVAAVATLFNLIEMPRMAHRVRLRGSPNRMGR